MLHLMYMILKNICTNTSLNVLKLGVCCRVFLYNLLLICAYKFTLVQSIKQTNKSNEKKLKRKQEKLVGNLLLFT